MHLELVLGLYWDIGIMEKKVETAIVRWGYMGFRVLGIACFLVCRSWRHSTFAVPTQQSQTFGMGPAGQRLPSVALTQSSGGQVI